MAPATDMGISHASKTQQASRDRDNVDSQRPARKAKLCSVVNWGVEVGVARHACNTRTRTFITVWPDRSWQQL